MRILNEELYDTKPDMGMITADAEEQRKELNKNHLKAKMEKALSTIIPEIIEKCNLSHMEFTEFLINIIDCKENRFNVLKDKAICSLGAYDPEEEIGYVLYYETYLDGASLWEMVVISHHGIVPIENEIEVYIDMPMPEMEVAVFRYMRECMMEILWVKNYMDLCDVMIGKETLSRYEGDFLSNYGKYKRILEVYEEVKDIMEFAPIKHVDYEGNIDHYWGLVSREKGKRRIGVLENQDGIQLSYLVEDINRMGGYQVVGIFAGNMDIFGAIAFCRLQYKNEETDLLAYVDEIKEYLEEIYMEKKQEMENNYLPFI